jgi:hypothetical protein
MQFPVVRLDLPECVLMGFMLVFETRIDLAQIDLGTGNDPKPFAVIHFR